MSEESDRFRKRAQQCRDLARLAGDTHQYNKLTRKAEDWDARARAMMGRDSTALPLPTGRLEVDRLRVREVLGRGDDSPPFQDVGGALIVRDAFGLNSED